MSIVYRSYANASEAIEAEYGLQPRILAYLSPARLSRQVPLETLNVWLNSPEDVYCYAAWRELAPEVHLPDFPTLEIKPEATTEVRVWDR